MTYVGAKNRLLSLATASLSPRPAAKFELLDQFDEGLVQELMLFLAKRNGFYAFESALHVFPTQDSLLGVGLETWNSPGGWRQEYGDLADGCLFFAEDVFGGQFCISGSEVWTFDPETGEKASLGNTIEGWASSVLDDWNNITGYPLGREWQAINGELEMGYRLMPKVPFVCNGAFEVDNLAAIPAEKGMRARANLAIQIRDLPDGATIQFQIVE